jgi:predicted porin
MLTSGVGVNRQFHTANINWMAFASCMVLLFAFPDSSLVCRAQTTDQKRSLEERIVRLEKELKDVEAELATLPDMRAGSHDASTAMKAPEADASADVRLLSAATLELASTAKSTVSANPKHRFFEKKPGDSLTFFTPNGEITAYGNLDVSFDAATKGTANLLAPDGSGPIGNMGWMPDISTNIAYVGIRGTQKLGSAPFSFIYQMETGIDIASSSGVSESNSSESDVVKGGLTSRNSYLGLKWANWGAAMFGKTDAPYKLTTMRMNPFYGMIGDYQVITGNTGGDNRVEFSTRLDHSMWFASRDYHGLRYDVLFSPGQNRSADSDNIAAGESDCTGGDIPGSGGSLPYACNDGSFSNAVSADLAYDAHKIYLSAAYERHMKVNRSSDLTGIYAAVPAGYMNADTADEDAAKAGVQYSLPSRTTLSAVYENLHRYVPAFLEFQNERQRQGHWFALTQELPGKDTVSAGWARAYRTPGDPGQHNTSLAAPPLGAPGDATGGMGANNAANMFTAAYVHKIAKGLTAYIDWAATLNGPYAHYDLGGGGRSVTTDCHDASDATGGESSDPHCWAGGHLVGISAGLNRKF